MPVTPTYPGVYIQEAPSDIHPITGVQTSIAAFVGATKYGPTTEAREIHSYTDFERVYGGRWEQSKLGFAVYDFFLNGGSTALIARAFGGDVEAAKSNIDVKGLNLKATDPGSWGNNLRVAVLNLRDDAAGIKRFDLVVVLLNANGELDYVSSHKNLTVDPKDQTRLVGRVLELESDMVRAVPEAVAPTAAHDIPKDNSKATFNNPSCYSSGTDGADGDPVKDKDFLGDDKTKAGALSLLEKVDLFNLLCIPPFDGDDVSQEIIDAATALCERRRAIYLIDPPVAWNAVNAALDTSKIGNPSANAAVYFPRLKQANPLHGGAIETFVPCGAVAGVIARTDRNRGVWKAPAGNEATVDGVRDFTVKLNDDENGQLNPLGVNCLRSFPERGKLIWGARTRKGADILADQWKHLPIRRLALFLEESLYRGTSWVVFEPNDEPLWAQIRMNIGSFMHELFRKGAFQGNSPKEAYFVRCDETTTPEEDRNLGIVNIIVGFAPLKPAEFVIITFQQIIAQAAG